MDNLLEQDDRFLSGFCKEMITFFVFTLFSVVVLGFVKTEIYRVSDLVLLFLEAYISKSKAARSKIPTVLDVS